MKKLRISKNSLDLIQVPLAQPMIVVGRSPVCDQILRAPDVKPIHFILEWAGEGDFDPEQGLWTVQDVSEKLFSSSSAAIDATGEAVVLESGIQEFSGFKFSIVNDVLSASPVDPGVLSRGIQENLHAISQIPVHASQHLLEVIRMDNEEDRLLDVVHHQKGRGTIPRVPEVRIQWSLQDPKLVIVSKKDVSVSTLKNTTMSPDFLEDLSRGCRKNTVSKAQFVREDHQ